MTQPSFHFSVIGINHAHIHMQIEQMVEAGCIMKSFYCVEDNLAADFIERYPHIHRAKSEQEIFDDTQVKLILGAGIPCERAEMGIRAMRAGKDVMVDKPGAVTFEQLARLRQVQQETGRIYSIFYCERFHQKATQKAGELIRQGAIGSVVNVVCLGPHKLGLFQRPDWFYRKSQYGGILTDLATHMIDQVLYFTGAQDLKILNANIGNCHNPEYPELEDFGDIHLRAEDSAATAYIRVDWLTPEKLPTWGDGRVFIAGTEGYIELRKYIDIAHELHKGENHLYMVNGDGVHHIDCNDISFEYGCNLRDDILNRTQRTMSQAHCFYATELAIQAQEKAQRLRDVKDGDYLEQQSKGEKNYATTY